jgi:ElaB/YqjD/DUF883 family membrane-anchored ribosome-binding protein
LCAFDYMQAKYCSSDKKKEKRWLLRTFLGPDSNGAYRAMIAALINETDAALTCLRRWPDLAAEVLRECSAGAPPVRRHGFLYQRLSDHIGCNGPPEEVVAIKAVKAVASAVQARVALIAAHVHLCGEGYAGKSMTKKALDKGFSGSPLFRLTGTNLPDISIEDGRTHGMTSSVLEAGGVLNKRVRVLIQDYGGQEAFRVNHASYLAAPNSVYIIVVPLWDMRPQQGNTSKRVNEPMKLKYIVDKYRDWLKFINSVVPETGHKVRCITVLNFEAMFRKLPEHERTFTVEEAVDKLKEVQGDFTASSLCRLQFDDAPPIPVNSKNAANVQTHLVPVLRMAIEALRAAPVPMSPILQAVLDDMAVAVTGAWPLIGEESELQKRLQALVGAKHRLPAEVDNIPAVRDGVIRTIAEIVQTRLESCGDIIVFSPHSQSKNFSPAGPTAGHNKDSKRISINRPNWLSEQVLGDLFKPDAFHRGAGARDILLTHERIVNVPLPKGTDLTDAQRQLLPTLLQHIGACLPVTCANGEYRTIDTATDAGGATAPQHYFPAFNVIRMDASHAIPWRDPVHVIVRMFELKDPSTTVLPSGYFPALKVHIVGLYHGSNRVWLYQNGMELKMSHGLRVIVRGNDDDTSFTLEVETKADSSGECTVSAWEEMQRVRAVVVSDAGSWLKNVPLNELGLHPEDRLVKGRPISELEPLAATGVLKKEDEPFYFGDGRVDVLTVVRAGFASMEVKLDALAALAKSEFTTLSAHVKLSVEAAQRVATGNKVVLECLLQVLAKAPVNGRKVQLTAGDHGNYRGLEEQDEDVEAELWAERAQEFLAEHTARLQEAELTQTSQLRTMKEEIMGAFHAVVGEVKALAKTLKQVLESESRRREEATHALKQALTDEFTELQQSVTVGRKEHQRTLQQLAAIVDTSVPNELHRELQHIRRELKVLRTVQNHTLYGVYDVPLLPIITHYEGKGVFDTLRDLAYETWTLHFACPVCAQPAPSGPKGEGYKLQATHAWVRRVNKAVALGLKALSVMSLLGPVPLPGLGKLADYLPTGSFDKLREGAEEALKNAQKGLKKVEKGANTSAQAVGQLSAAAAAPSPVRVDLDYVHTIREVLLALKETPPTLKHTGLVRAICGDKGECAWVCKTGACKALFELDGFFCLRIKMEFA